MARDWNAPPEATMRGEPEFDAPSDDVVGRLQAEELPGERQRQREARIVLRGLLDDAAEEIMELRKLLLAAQ